MKFFVNINIKINFIESVAKGLKKLDDEFHKSTENDSRLKSPIEHFENLPGLDELNYAVDDWPFFIGEMFNLLKNELYGNFQRTQNEKDTKNLKAEILKFISKTFYPYEICLVEERVNNCTKTIEGIQHFDDQLRTEMVNDLNQIKKVVGKWNKYNDEDKEERLNDAKQIKKDVDKYYDLLSKVVGTDGFTNHQDEYNVFIQVNPGKLRDVASDFFRTSYAIKKWDEKNDDLTKQESDEFDNLQ